MVGEKNLVAEEQGGFRKGRECRDQLLPLVLLGQVKARSKRGMFAVFIDIKKAYDRVDQGKLWGYVAWKEWGLEVRSLPS